ncbi:hypothetical protein RISK_002295 [Rhodopirellula islandica]|uniref:Uncharacterized protein n=1 Tax=Rhodopirellula islandica TaxID=595434 RepID=A0A0J1BGJ1_RHOIS|nr:hypothetical protein [Rhodopirellula islandica]KLU05663.1 hypothetical protein RISK_002295 [Rhodopirellula islandica]
MSVLFHSLDHESQNANTQTISETISPIEAAVLQSVDASDRTSRTTLGAPS